MLSSGCFPAKKKTDATTPAPGISVDDVNNGLKVLEAKVTSLSDKIANLSSVQTNVSTLTANIDSAKADIAALKAQVAPTPDPTMKADLAALKTKVDSLQTSTDTLKTTMTTTNKSVAINNIGRKYLSVDVKGVGDYQVAVTIYGTNLAVPANVTLDTNNETSSVDSWQLYGNYTATLAQIAVVIPAVTVPVTGNTTESVIIPAQSVNVPVNNMTFVGTMLVVIVSPDKAWLAVDGFDIDIRGISGTIYSASANVITD